MTPSTEASPSAPLTKEQLDEIVAKLREGIEQHGRWWDTRFTDALKCLESLARNP